MSQETLADLNTNTLIGYTDKRGTAWHYRAEDQGEESNHYPAAIPMADVERRLFNWEAVEGTLGATALTKDGVLVAPNSDDWKPIMRSDNGRILGIFKPGYKPHQYAETLLTQVARITDSDLAIASAGLLKNGGQAWVQVEVEDTMEVEGFEYRPFLTAATSFDGSIASTYMTGAQAVVCDNTLSAAISSATHKFKVKHSTNSLGKLEDARQALDIVYSVGDVFADQVRDLLAVKVTDKQYGDFLQAYLDITPEKVEKGGRGLTIATNKQDALWNLWRNDKRVNPWAGTAFGVVQAVNTFDHHLISVRGDRGERNMAQAITGGFDKLDAGTWATLQGVLA